MENSVSFDERDLHDYIDIEYYMIDRGYELTYKEYLLMKDISQNFGVKTILYNYQDIDKGKIQFLVNFVFETPKREEFYCWTRVLKEDPMKVRHRDFSFNAEEIETFFDFENYLQERKYILNCTENALLQVKAHRLHVLRCKLDLSRKEDSFLNQTAGRLYFSFPNNQNIDTRIMYSKENVLERKRNEKI